MVYIGDTKHGRFVGQDRAGNKYYENTEEYPRTFPLSSGFWHCRQTIRDGEEI